MKIFGLIGLPLSHSFSKNYFTNYFLQNNIDAQYQLFELNSINELSNLIQQNTNLKGLNVTIPYKQSVISFLDEIDPLAKAVGAVNTIRIEYRQIKPYLIGYNTDIFGFSETIQPLLKPCYKKAIVLGNGGAAKAVTYVLNQLNIEFVIATRSVNKANHISYDCLNKYIDNHFIIINTTPLGMFPNIADCPQIPYDKITQNHLFFDLIYNPETTLFLKQGAKQGALIQNGFKMLQIQADRAWQIWNYKL